jgi:mannosyltransferase
LGSVTGTTQLRAGSQLPRVAARQSSIAYRWLGLAVVGLAATTTLYGIGGKSLWHDEAFTVEMGRIDLLSALRAIIDREAFNGLYFTLIHPVVRLSEAEWWVRLPSAVFAIATVYMVFILMRRLFGVRPAAIAAVLIATNSFFVNYAQETRAYSMALFGVVLATYLLVRAVEEPSRGRWFSYGLAAALSVFAHFLSAWVVLSHVLSLIICPRKLAKEHLAIAFTTVGVLTLPLLGTATRGDPMSRAFIERPSLNSLEPMLIHLTGGQLLRTREARLLLLTCLALLSVAVLTMVRRRLRGEASAAESWSRWMLLSWLVVPLVGSFVTSAVVPTFIPRYLIVAVPPLLMLCAVGLADLNNRVVASIALAAMLLLSGLGLLGYYRATYKEGENWRAAVAHVAEEARPGDGAIFLSRYGRRPFQYYLRQHGGLGADITPIYPSAAWKDYESALADLDVETTQRAASILSQAKPEYDRVWVVLLWRGFESWHEDGRTVEKALNHSYDLVEDRSFGSALTIQLYNK